MANLRNLKKGIAENADVLIEELWFKNIYRDSDPKKTSELIVRAAAFKREFIRRANHIDAKNDPKAVKAYFSKLYDDMKTELVAIIDEINKL